MSSIISTNLQCIESKIILKVIFKHLRKIQYLDIIRYNKKLQNIIGINILDYQKEGNKIKIGERNGIGEEREKYTNILLFKGKYLDGKKNGEGIEYYQNGAVKFKGKYFQGNIIEGKGYDYEGKEYLIIDKDGKGKEYNIFGNLIFEGEYFNGRKGMEYTIIYMEKKNLK